MKYLSIAGLIVCLSLSTFSSSQAQQSSATGPLPPCSSFGTAALTCTQGNDNRLGAGAVTGAVKANGSNTFSQAASTDLSDATSGSCSLTDNSGGALTFTNKTCSYVKIGTSVCVTATLTFPSTADTHAFALTGLPFAAANRGVSGETTMLQILSTYTGAALGLFVDQNATTATGALFLGGGTIQNVTLSTKTVYINGCYPTA